MIPQESVEEVIRWAAGRGIATPTLLLAPAVLEEGVSRLRRDLGGRISYATKANASPDVLLHLTDLVDEFNVSNSTHLETLVSLGVAPTRINLIHPVLTPEVVHSVIELGIRRFVIDDERGLALLREGGAAVRVTLRMLPPEASRESRSLVRFGNTPEVLRGLARKCAEAGLEIEALSVFVGTATEWLSEGAPFDRVISQLARLREDLLVDGIRVPAVNIGGGFPGSRSGFYVEHPEFFGEIRQALTKYLGSEVEIVSEPGRYLIEPSMAMLTRVVADRVIGGRRIVYLDVSAYSGLFEFCFIEHGGERVKIQHGTTSVRASSAVVVGPIMDSFDVLKRHAELPPVQEGQLVVIPNVGAYSWGYCAPCEGLSPPGLVELPADLGRSFASAVYSE